MTKFIIRYEYSQPREGEKCREFTPFEINMLNATEKFAGIKINQGKLEEITPRFWKFTFESPRTKREIVARITMTDEDLEDKHKEVAQPGVRALKRPSFK